MRQKQTNTLNPVALDIAAPVKAIASQPSDAKGAQNVVFDLLLADSRSEETRRAYTSDINQFFAFHCGESVSPQAVAELCRLDAGGLALALNSYKAHLRERKLAEATINRRLAAVRSLLRMARRLGATCPDPAGLVASEKVVPYRDTGGPSLEDVRKLLQAPDRETPVGRRDYALLLLLCENALRRGELCACNVADFDARRQQLWILGKGKGSQKEAITLSPFTVAALEEMLRFRVAAVPAAPLFCNVSRAAKGEERLTGRGLLHIVNGYGQRVLGRSMHPHALRHTAITLCLNATNGDVRTAQRLSRHADIRTLMLYDDNRENLQGKATQLLSGLLASDE